MLRRCLQALCQGLYLKARGSNTRARPVSVRSSATIDAESSVDRPSRQHLNLELDGERVVGPGKLASPTLTESRRTRLVQRISILFVSFKRIGKLALSSYLR